jgi:hypothetical protein
MDKEYSMRVREDGIVVFRIPELSRKVIDWWMEDLERLGQAWIENELVLLLVDIRGSSAVTPYIKGKLADISAAVPASPEIRTAFWVDGGPARLTWERFVQDLGPLLGDKRVFTDPDKALGWLYEVL